MNLDVNNARVLSSYTDSRTVIQNGLLEWDAVDTNVNMPILNYKVNVNLPVYDQPDLYSAKEIQTNGIYTLGDLVNDNVTNYNWLDKTIPVSISLSSVSNELYYISYNNVNYTLGDFTASSTSIYSIPSGKILVYLLRYTNYLLIRLYENNSSASKNVNLNAGGYHLIVNRVGSTGLFLKNYNSDNLLILNDANETDGESAELTIYPNTISYSGFFS